MEHNNRWMSNFVDGVWTGPEDRMVTVFNDSEGTRHCIDDLAKEQGITLPDWDSKPKTKSKKHINIDIEEKSYEDMEGTHDSRDTEVDDRGNSEG